MESPPVCGLVNAPKALRSKYFRHVHAAAKMIQISSFANGGRTGENRRLSLSPLSRLRGRDGEDIRL